MTSSKQTTPIFFQVCYLCENQGRESRASSGACMQCNKSGCKQAFHVTCAQRAGLLCEEAGNYSDNVKYCGYCEYHYQRIVSTYLLQNTPHSWRCWPKNPTTLRVLLLYISSPSKKSLIFYIYFASTLKLDTFNL